MISITSILIWYFIGLLIIIIYSAQEKIRSRQESTIDTFEIVSTLIFSITGPTLLIFFYMDKIQFSDSKMDKFLRTPIITFPARKEKEKS